MRRETSIAGRSQTARQHKLWIVDCACQPGQATTVAALPPSAIIRNGCSKGNGDVELASRGITVNAVAPGVIETDMSRPVRELAGDMVKSRILLRRYGQPEDIAHAVWFLASSYADYITGEILHVDGGFKME